MDSEVKLMMTEFNKFVEELKKVFETEAEIRETAEKILELH
jgi:hypothetical protein